MLKTGTVVDATLIAALSMTKNETGERYPESNQAKKGNQWHFGMKAQIGVDAESDLVYGKEKIVFADAGYRSAEKREEFQEQHLDVDWQIGPKRGEIDEEIKAGFTI